MLCFDPSPVWDAGNRYGVSGQLDVSGGAKAAFEAFARTVAKAKSAGLPKPDATVKAEPEAQPADPGKPQQLFETPPNEVPH